MFRYLASRRRRRRRSEAREEEDDHDGDDDDEAVQLLPIAADKSYAKQAPPPSQQQQQQHADAPASQQPHVVACGDEGTPLVQQLVTKPHHQQQHRHRHHHHHHTRPNGGELYGLVQKLATKLEKSEARNQKLADNLSVIKVLHLQLDDARRLLRAVLWPYHGDYNSKDYIKAIEHVSALRVELRRQQQEKTRHKQAWMANLETWNQIRKKESSLSSPDELIPLLHEQAQERNDTKVAAETPTHTTTTTTSVLQDQNTSLQEQVTKLKQTIKRLEDERERHVKEIGTLLERSMQLQEELEATKPANNDDREDIADVSEQRSDLREGDLDELMKQFKHESEHLFE